MFERILFIIDAASDVRFGSEIWSFEVFKRKIPSPIPNLTLQSSNSNSPKFHKNRLSDSLVFVVAVFTTSRALAEHGCDHSAQKCTALSKPCLHNCLENLFETFFLVVKGLV